MPGCRFPRSGVPGCGEGAGEGCNLSEGDGEGAGEAMGVFEPG